MSDQINEKEKDIKGMCTTTNVEQQEEDAKQLETQVAAETAENIGAPQEEQDPDHERVESPNQAFHRVIEEKCGELALKNLAEQVGREVAEQAIEQSSQNIAALLEDWKVSPSPAANTPTAVISMSESMAPDEDSQASLFSWPKDGTGWDTQAETVIPPPPRAEIPNLDGENTGKALMIAPSTSTAPMDFTNVLLGKRGREVTNDSTEEDDVTPQVRRKSRKSKSKCILSDNEGASARKTRSQGAVQMVSQPQSVVATTDSEQPNQSCSETDGKLGPKKPVVKKAARKKRSDEPRIDQLIHPLHTTEELNMMTVNDASVAAVEWLEDIDTIRARSSYQGALSGQIRKRVDVIKETVRLLAEKLEDTGDPAYLRRRNAELLAELTAAKRESIKLKKDVEDLKKKVHDLTTALTFDTQRADKATSPMDVSQSVRPKPQNRKEVDKRERSRSNSSKATVRGEAAGTEVVMRPPLQGISKPIPAVEKSGLRSLQDHDHRLDAELSRQIVELTTRRRELRQTSRSDQNTSRAPSPSRGKPRVIGNVQIAPPLSAAEFPALPLPSPAPIHPRDDGDMEWTAVKNKKQKRKQRKAADQAETHLNKVDQPKEGKGKQPKTEVGLNKTKLPGTKRRRPPRTAAVAIKGCSEDFSYAAALRQLREKISLPDMGISKTTVRHTANGGVIIEVPGPDRAVKAEALREKVCSLLGGSAQVTRPVIKGDIRLIGLDDSVVPEEIQDVIGAEGGCDAKEVKVGTIRPMTNGLYTVWAQCPLGAAIKASQPGKIKVGWTIAKIELLKTRPMQCYRCWGHGHVKANCSSPNDRSKNCYRCGQEGHAALSCSNPPSCILCSEQGKDARHRVGTAQCKAEFKTTKEKPARRAEEMVIENA